MASEQRYRLAGRLPCREHETWFRMTGLLTWRVFTLRRRSWEGGTPRAIRTGNDAWMAQHSAQGRSDQQGPDQRRAVLSPALVGHRQRCRK